MNPKKASLTSDPYLLGTESETRVIASLESGSDKVIRHEPLVDEIDGSMRALGLSIFMAAVICALVAVAYFSGWVK